MIELGAATEREMILEFLMAEADSPRFGAYYAPSYQQLAQQGISRETLIEHADLNSERDNIIRASLLGAVRGYRANTLLFTGFPNDVLWRRVGLQRSDWEIVMYANEANWVAFSGGTRRVIDGVNQIQRVVVADINTNVNAVAAQIRQGHQYPALIGVENENEEIILIEGHTRATAYALVQPVEPVQCLVGTSSTMSNWIYY